MFCGERERLRERNRIPGSPVLKFQSIESHTVLSAVAGGQTGAGKVKRGVFDYRVYLQKGHVLRDCKPAIVRDSERLGATKQFGLIHSSRDESFHLSEYHSHNPTKANASDK